MIDLHLHTTASDGLCDPAALVDVRRRLEVFSEELRSTDRSPEWAIYGALIINLRNIVDAMDVVAEAVETWAEAARLTELGCDRAHGWLFASPQRADRARWLLSRGAGWRGGLITPETRARPFVPSPRPAG